MHFRFAAPHHIVLQLLLLSDPQLSCSCPHSLSRCFGTCKHALSFWGVFSQLTTLSMGHIDSNDAGSPRHTPTGMAVHLVPQDRQASWDSHKWLAFTPPASLTSVRMSRRVSQGLPGGAGKLTQPDDSALRLPPLTPPGAEASNPAASGSFPEASVMPLPSRSATPNSRRSADPLGSEFYSHPAGPFTAGTADTQPNTLSSSSCNQQAPIQQRRGSNSAHSVLHAAGNAAICDQANRIVCTGQEQVEASNVATAAHAQEQQQNQCGATSSVQPQQRHASSAGDDTGQLGPPITRMRPALPPAGTGSSGNKSVAKQQAAADTAEAALVDALLCGWEQQTNDGVSAMAVNLIALVLAVLYSPLPLTPAPAIFDNHIMVNASVNCVFLSHCQSICQ